MLRYALIFLVVAIVAAIKTRLEVEQSETRITRALEVEHPRPNSFVKHPEESMLRYALIFLVVAIVAAVFGFGGVAAEAAWIAKILFFVFLVLFVVMLVLGRKGPSTGL